MTFPNGEIGVYDWFTALFLPTLWFTVGFNHIIHSVGTGMITQLLFRPKPEPTWGMQPAYTAIETAQFLCMTITSYPLVI